MTQLRADLQLLADLIPASSRVLDVGCGDGTLMAYLEAEKGCDARGLELSRDGVNACLERGLSVVQGDADSDLEDYPADGFDIAVLSQTIQATRAPADVLRNLLRIAPAAIISFPNFGHWAVRTSLLFKGRMPVTKSLPVSWHETPNIHMCTVRDFAELAKNLNIEIADVRGLKQAGKTWEVDANQLRYANLMAEQALFLLRRKA